MVLVFFAVACETVKRVVVAILPRRRFVVLREIA
jgi:hypothetical protein